MRSHRHLFPIVFVTMLFAAASALAGGTETQAPNAKADANTAKATAAYNEGVLKVKRADAIGMGMSKTFAYDYAARPDGKALREYEQAIGDFATAVSLKQDYKEAHNYLGYCYRRLGKLEHSLAAYDKAIKLDPKFALAREYRGETYLALGQPEKAEAELAELKKQGSDQAAVLEMSIAMYRDREKQAASAGGR
jgi:tetratricopeptide (TPR) repeat protein